MTFLYDENGAPSNVFLHDGTNHRVYVYVKNLQGDIVAIANSAGTIVATYTYDAWGKLRASTDTDSLQEPYQSGDGSAIDFRPFSPFNQGTVP